MTLMDLTEPFWKQDHSGLLRIQGRACGMRQLAATPLFPLKVPKEMPSHSWGPAPSRCPSLQG